MDSPQGTLILVCSNKFTVTYILQFIFFLSHSLLLSNRCTKLDEIWLIHSSNYKEGFSCSFKLSLYDIFSSNYTYANDLLGSYIACIFTIYYYMSLCNIAFLTSSLKLIHRFAFVRVLHRTPTKFVKIRMLAQFFLELWLILCNF